jgi:hypothetical protein
MQQLVNQFRLADRHIEVEGIQFGYNGPPDRRSMDCRIGELILLGRIAVWGN